MDGIIEYRKAGRPITTAYEPRKAVNYPGDRDEAAGFRAWNGMTRALAERRNGDIAELVNVIPTAFDLLRPGGAIVILDSKKQDWLASRAAMKELPVHTLDVVLAAEPGASPFPHSVKNTMTV